MLKRTERFKTSNPEHHARLFAESKETLEELLVRVGAKKVKSYPATPETKAKTATEEPPTIKL